MGSPLPTKIFSYAEVKNQAPTHLLKGLKILTTWTNLLIHTPLLFDKILKFPH
jgi:hypothetical protein